MWQADRQYPDARTADVRQVKTCMPWGRKTFVGILVTSIISLSSSALAACPRPGNIDVSVSTDAAALVVRTDYSLANLAQLAGTVLHTPPHQVLGFYADSIGFTLQPPTLDAGDCPDVTVRMQLVTTRRVIELANDLETCLANAALKHYRLHAELQAQALTHSARILEPALRQYLTDALSSNGGTQAEASLLDGQLRAFVVRWLDDFQAGVTSLQTAADTSAELDMLRRACSV